MSNLLLISSDFSLVSEVSLLELSFDFLYKFHCLNDPVFYFSEYISHSYFKLSACSNIRLICGPIFIGCFYS